VPSLLELKVCSTLNKRARWLPINTATRHPHHLLSSMLGLPLAIRSISSINMVGISHLEVEDAAGVGAIIIKVVEVIFTRRLNIIIMQVVSMALLQ
jgi:hypothetical protein